MSPRVVLVGTMGAGKTTVGSLLAEAWGVGFRDTDQDVEATAGKSVQDIFVDEGELLDWLNRAADDATPVVLNAAAWSHYSYALLDACAQLTAPLVEVHISDPKQRPEEFRHHSVVTAYAAHEVVGRGVEGYRVALEHLAGS